MISSPGTPVLRRLGALATFVVVLIVLGLLLRPAPTVRKEPASALTVGHPERAKGVLLVLDPGHGGQDRGGYNKNGFTYNGDQVPEDAYTFDVATRIETTARLKGWKTFSTVIPLGRDSLTLAPHGDTILTKRAYIVYNRLEKDIIVFPGAEGLRLRLDAARDGLDGAPDSHSVFISLHFDHAPPGFAGAKIYTVPQLASHPFVTILSETLTTHGLGYRNHDKRLPNVDTSQKFVVLAEGRVEPRVLIELGNFNNAGDRARMLSPSGRQRYADVVVEALSEYLSVENR